MYAVPFRRALAVIIGLTALLAFNILLTACGGRLFDAPQTNDAMPLTALLGTVTAWLMPGLLCVVLVKLHGARSGDPARRTPPTLHASGANAVAVRQAAQIARRWGWSVRTAPRRANRGKWASRWSKRSCRRRPSSTRGGR